MSENLIGLGGASVDTSLYVKSCLWVVWTVSFLIGNFGSSLGFDLMLHWPASSVVGRVVVVVVVAVGGVFTRAHNL